jgi:hypothetical protein
MPFSKLYNPVFKPKKINGMNEKEKWLQERINKATPVDPTEQPFIDRILEKEGSEAELSSCIDCVEVLLSLDALVPLLNFMKDEQQSMTLRKHAAKAISAIGSRYVETQLEALRASPSSDLRLLAEIAING